MNPTIIIGLLIPFLGTMLGSGFVFLMRKDMPVRLQKAIAANHGKSLHQIVLRWHIQRGIAIFPMSRNKAHMADNLHLFDFELTDEEMARIAALDKGRSAFFSHQDPAIVEWFGQMVEERKKQGHHPASEKKAW